MFKSYKKRFLYDDDEIMEAANPKTLHKILDKCALVLNNIEKYLPSETYKNYQEKLSELRSLTFKTTPFSDEIFSEDFKKDKERFYSLANSKELEPVLKALFYFYMVTMSSVIGDLADKLNKSKIDLRSNEMIRKVYEDYSPEEREAKNLTRHYDSLNALNECMLNFKCLRQQFIKQHITKALGKGSIGRRYEVAAQTIMRGLQIVDPSDLIKVEVNTNTTEINSNLRL